MKLKFPEGSREKNPQGRGTCMNIFWDKITKQNNQPEKKKQFLEYLWNVGDREMELVQIT